MSVSISSKALILSDYNNLIPFLKDILLSINIEPYSEDINPLSSLSAMKKKIESEGNLSFIKKEILSFIQNNGYPSIIIIDLKTNTGSETDYDKSKILKNFLLSFIILMESEQYKNISCNLLILSDKKEYNQFQETHRHPQDILSILKTNDERLNTIIKDYISNNDKFKKNFNILITDAEQEISLIKSGVILFINMIKSKERLKSKLLQEKPVSAARPRIDAADAADAILRSGEFIFKNGEPPVKYDAKLNLTEKEIYILGNFTSYTRLDVMGKLLRLIKTGFGSEFTLKKDDLLILNISDKSIIDSTTPITLAQLLSKELLDFKKIKIKTSASNYKLMQQAKGFSMIEKNIIIQDK